MLQQLFQKKKKTRLANGVQDVSDVESRPPVLIEDVRADLSGVCLHVWVVYASHKLHLRSTPTGGSSREDAFNASNQNSNELRNTYKDDTSIDIA